MTMGICLFPVNFCSVLGKRALTNEIDTLLIAVEALKINKILTEYVG